MKRVLFLAMATAALSGAGCASNCVKLAQKICDCQTTQVDRDNCNANVSARADQVNPTSADEDTCGKLIDTCDCHDLNTPQGKQNCGLAR